MIFMIAVMIIFLLFAKPIVSLFTDRAEVIHHAAQCLTVVSIGYIFFSYIFLSDRKTSGAKPYFACSIPSSRAPKAAAILS